MPAEDKDRQSALAGLAARESFEIIPLIKKINRELFLKNLIPQEHNFSRFPTTDEALRDAGWLLGHHKKNEPEPTFKDILDQLRIASIPIVIHGKDRYSLAFNVAASDVVELNGEVLVNHPATGSQVSKITNAVLGPAFSAIRGKDDVISTYLPLSTSQRGVYLLNAKPVEPA